MRILNWIHFFLYWNRLHEEIVQFAEYTTAIVDEMAVDIEATIENVRQSVKQLWKDAIVETFGSYSTGFWLPSSDVDLVILVNVHPFEMVVLMGIY